MFLTELQSRATSCNVKEKDRMIRDKIVFSVSGKLQELLLCETKLDLKKAIETCPAFEITSRNTKEMSAGSEAQTIDKVGVQSKLKQKCAVKSQQKYIPCILKECNFCDKSHEAVKTKCPARGKTCKHCKGRNHFDVKCKKAHSLNVDGDSTDSEEQWLATVVTDHNKRVTVLMRVNGCDVRFQLDSGADINTICQKICEEVTSETHVQETDYVEQIKVNSTGRNYFGSLQSKECTSE